MSGSSIGPRAAAAGGRSARGGAGARPVERWPPGCRVAVGRRQVQRLERRTARRRRARRRRSRRRAQDQLVARARHRRRRTAGAPRADGRRRRPAPSSDERGRERQRIAPAAGREPAGDEPGQEHDRELEALRLVDRQYRDRVRVRIEVRRRRDRRPPRSASGGGARRTSPDRRPGAPTGRGRCRRTGRRSGAPLRPPTVLARPAGRASPVSPQERVEDLARRSLVGERREPAQVGDEPVHAPTGSTRPDRRRPGWRSSSSRTSQSVRFRRRALATIAVRSSPPRPYGLRRGERVDVDARAEVRDGPQEREQQPDLRAGRTARTSRRTARPRRPGSRLRRIGSASAFARTRMAWSRGAAAGGDPARRSRRRSSPPPRSRSRSVSRRTAARRGPAARSGARKRLSIPARTSSRSGSLNRMSRWAGRRGSPVRDR